MPLFVRLFGKAARADYLRDSLAARSWVQEAKKFQNRKTTGREVPCQLPLVALLKQPTIEKVDYLHSDRFTTAVARVLTPILEFM
jgi:hypothetical protein